MRGVARGVYEMCRISDEIREEGHREGLEEGREETMVTCLGSLVRSGMSMAEAFARLEVPVGERAHYEAALSGQLLDMRF